MRLRTVIAVVLATLSLAACTGPPTQPRDPEPTGAASGRPMPSGFSGARAWTTNVTWSRSGLTQTGVPATPVPASQYQPPAGFGLVAVAGDVVVAATFTAPATRSPSPVTLQFHNAKTGAVIASKALESWDFAGIRADTAGGRPVVEVRYSPIPMSSDSTFVTTVFDTSAHQLWTSAGRKVGGLGQPGLLFVSGSALVSHGFLLRENAGSNSWNRGASYDVLDLTNKIVMNIPYHAFYNATNPAQSAPNIVQLIGGYAVVIHGDPRAYGSPPPTQARFWYTVYDLSQGGKKVADVPESVPVSNISVRIAPHAVGSCGSKLVLMWAIASTPSQSDVHVSVLDLRNFQTTRPITFSIRPRNIAPQFTALADSACTTMVLDNDIPSPLTFAISLNPGTLLWQTEQPNRYLSIHDGVIYAFQTRQKPSSPIGRLESMAAADRTPLDGDLAVAPLAFTPDGSPVFAQLTEPTVCEPPPPSPTGSAGTTRPGGLSRRPDSCKVTVWVGRAAG